MKFKLILVSCLCSSFVLEYLHTDRYGIKYSAATGGNKISLEINEDSTYINEFNRMEDYKFEKKVETNKSQMDQLINEINQIPLDKISSFNAPSHGFKSDAGVATYLVIIKNGKLFAAPTYDYHNPNITLKRLDSLLKNQIRIIKEIQ